MQPRLLIYMQTQRSEQQNIPEDLEPTIAFSTHRGLHSFSELELMQNSSRFGAKRRLSKTRRSTASELVYSSMDIQAHPQMLCSHRAVMIMDTLIQGGLAFACQYGYEHKQGTIFEQIRWVFLGLFGFNMFMLILAFCCGLHRWNLAIMRFYGWFRLLISLVYFFVGMGYLTARCVLNYVAWDYMKTDDVWTNWNKTLIILGYYVGGFLLGAGFLMILTTACYRFGRMDARAEYEIQKLLGA